jgi:hypothetical protein
MIQPIRTIAIVSLVVFALTAAAPSLADDRLVILDQDGRAMARITEAGDGSVNIYDARSNRAGYGVRRSDGSVDLFRPDGSRLGHFQLSSSGQPSRLIVVPKRR